MDASTLMQQLQQLQQLQQQQQQQQSQQQQQQNGDDSGNKNSDYGDYNNNQGDNSGQNTTSNLSQGARQLNMNIQGQNFLQQPQQQQPQPNANNMGLSFLQGTTPQQLQQLQLQLQQQQMTNALGSLAGLAQQKQQQQQGQEDKTGNQSGINDGLGMPSSQGQQQMMFPNFQQQQPPIFMNQNQQLPQQQQQQQNSNNNNNQQQNQQQFNPQQLLLGSGLLNPMAAQLAGMMLGGQMNPQQLQQLQQLQMAQQLLQQGLPVMAAAGLNLGQAGGVGAPQAGLPLQLSSALSNAGLMGNNATGFQNGHFQPNAVTGNALSQGIMAKGTTGEMDGSSGSKTEVEWAEPFAGKGKKEPPFPLKLHQILSNPEFQECICWNPHGRSWRILKPPVFEQVVIPLYFRHAKYASFMRQVNGWGFRRIVSGNDHNSYFHELFVRDCPQLCMKMKRMKKGAGADPDDDEKEQNTSMEEEQEVGDGEGGGSDGEKNHQEEESVNNNIFSETEKSNTNVAEDPGIMTENTSGQVDSATLNKLQEALAAGGAAGSFLQQQTVNGEGTAGNTGLSHLHESSNNKGDLGAGDFDLASQLQAATQPLQQQQQQRQQQQQEELQQQQDEEDEKNDTTIN